MLSKLTGSLFLIVILTAFKCVFMATSTPVTVPWTCVPFFSSIVTVSCDNFIRNLKQKTNVCCIEPVKSGSIFDQNGGRLQHKLGTF